MGKLTDALRKLGTKLTGKPTIESNSVVKIINDIADDYEGSTGGGVVLVDELPEIGDENLLYKTPDGKIWSCTYSMEKILQVGESYTLKSAIATEDLKKFVNDFTSFVWYFDENETKYIDSYIEYEEANKYIIGYHIDSEGSQSAIFRVAEESSIENVQITLDGFDNIPSVTITEYFVNNIKTDGSGLSLSDLIFLFDVEPVNVCKWTLVNTPQSYIANVWCYYKDYEAVLTLTVDDNTLETYADLLNYLKNKKCSGPDGGDFVIYPCSGIGTDGAIFGIHAQTLEPDTEGYERIVAHSNTVYDSAYIADDPNFSISYAK